MPAAVAAAVTTAIGLTGTAAAIVGAGVQLAVAYGVSSLSKPDAPSQPDRNREVTLTGGDTPERVIYGRAKVGGTLYMAQKYNGYVYQGVAICRHPCEEIETIYFDKKAADHPDFSNTELETVRINFVGGPVAAGSATNEVTVTFLGVDYTHTASVGDTAVQIRDAVSALIPNTEGYEILLSVSNTDPYIQIERLTGTATDWQVDAQVVSDIDGVTTNINQESGNAGSLIPRIITELGNQTSANADLVAELDFADVTHRWTVDHKLQGITHINVRWPSDYVRDTLGRLPEITVVLRGKNNILDPRTGATGYTANAALCLRDYLTQPYGFAATAAELPDAEWIAAANVCDEAVAISSTDTQARYVVNTMMTTDTQPGDALQIFSDSMQAPVVWTAGAWVIRPAVYSIPSIELTVDDLAGNIQYTDRPSTQDRFNKIQGTFINPDQEWGAHDYPSIFVDDGLDERTGNLSFTTEIDAYRAQRLAQLHLLLNYSSAPVRIEIKRLSVYIGVDRMIALTVPVLGWSKKTFYVAQRDDNEDGTATLTLFPREPWMYEWDFNDAQPVDTITTDPVFVIRQDLTA